MQPCLTDYVCLFPIAQQVVGIATIFSNFIKMIYDLAQGILTQTWKGETNLYEEREEALGTDEEKKITQILLDLPGYQFERHVMYVHIGIARFIPIIGTLYSIGVLAGLIKLQPVLDDPRWGRYDPRRYQQVNV